MFCIVDCTRNCEAQSRSTPVFAQQTDCATPEAMNGILGNWLHDFVFEYGSHLCLHGVTGDDAGISGSGRFGKIVKKVTDHTYSSTS